MREASRTRGLRTASKSAPYSDGTTQIPAPSNEAGPPTLTVKLDCTPAAQACTPTGGGGTTKLIWYNPAYPGTSPAYSGMGNAGPNESVGCMGLVASAFGRKLKSRKKVWYVGVAVAAGWPVVGQFELLNN